MFPAAPIQRRAVQQILQHAARRAARSRPLNHPEALRCFSVLATTPMGRPVSNNLNHFGRVRNLRVDGAFVRFNLPQDEAHTDNSTTMSSTGSAMKSFTCELTCMEVDDGDDDGG
jgi:hypothetical protein